MKERKIVLNAKEEAKNIVDIMVEKQDYVLIINKQKDNQLCECNTAFHYAWEDNFQDKYRNDYSAEELMEILMECDKCIILDATKTIFVY